MLTYSDSDRISIKSAGSWLKRFLVFELSSDIVLKKNLLSMAIFDFGEKMINKFECDYPCDDVKKDIIYPEIELNPERIKIVIVSECPIENKDDYFYKSDSGTFFKNTRMIFEDAGFTVNNYDDLLKMEVYLTTAIKCRKAQYLVSAKTIKECSLRYLKREIDSFPNLKVILCMGDFAIKAINYVFKERCNDRVIKAGATYKIRNEEHILDKIRFFPSYTHTGDSFGIEKSKRKMIIDDVKNAFNYIDSNLE